MTKVEYGKSDKWRSEHCCICKKTLGVKEDRVKGTATFLNDETVRVLYCVPCATTAEMQEAIKQTKALGKKDA